MKNGTPPITKVTVKIFLMKNIFNPFLLKCIGISKDKWTSLLNDIINLEYVISQARSLKIKIAPNCIQLNEEVCNF